MSRRTLLDDIVVDAEVQPRVKIDPDTVREYAEQYETDARKMPAVAVMHVGKRIVLVDGFHRFAAAKLLGLQAINTEKVGDSTDYADVMTQALQYNHNHGLKRTSADKRRAVERALKYFPEHSDRMLADRTGVSNTTVSRIRNESSNQLSHCDSSTEGHMSQAEANAVVTQAFADGLKRLAFGGEEDPDDFVEFSEAELDKDFGMPKELAKEERRMGKDGKKRALPKPKKAKIVTVPSDTIVNLTKEQLDKSNADLRDIEKQFRTLVSTAKMRRKSLDPYVASVVESAAKTVGGAVVYLVQSERLLCDECLGKGCQGCSKNGWITRTALELRQPRKK